MDQIPTVQCVFIEKTRRHLIRMKTIFKEVESRFWFVLKKIKIEYFYQGRTKGARSEGVTCLKQVVMVGIRMKHIINCLGQMLNCNGYNTLRTCYLQIVLLCLSLFCTCMVLWKRGGPDGWKRVWTWLEDGSLQKYASFISILNVYWKYSLIELKLILEISVVDTFNALKWIVLIKSKIKN